MTQREETFAPEAAGTDEATKYSRILVGTDGSACSRQAARHATYLAKILGAELYALNAIDVERTFHIGVHFGEAIEELERLGREALQEVNEIAAEKGIRCVEMLVRGRPHKAIIEAAEEIGADLIVVGSVGMTSVEMVLLGSESQKVLYYSKLPVLLVREP
jgi:nucleotide-binding universal stress UspA family protein